MKPSSKQPRSKCSCLFDVKLVLPFINIGRRGTLPFVLLHCKDPNPHGRKRFLPQTMVSSRHQVSHALGKALKSNGCKGNPTDYKRTCAHLSFLYGFHPLSQSQKNCNQGSLPRSTIATFPSLRATRHAYGRLSDFALIAGMWDR